MLDPNYQNQNVQHPMRIGGEGHSRLGLDTRDNGDEAMYRLRLQLWEQ